jgi:hypothetical protein
MRAHDSSSTLTGHHFPSSLRRLTQSHAHVVFYNVLHPTMQLIFVATAQLLEIAPPTSSRALRKPRSVTEHVLVIQKHGTQPHLIVPSFPLEAILRIFLSLTWLPVQGSLSDPQTATSIITNTPAH